MTRYKINCLIYKINKAIRAALWISPAALILYVMTGNFKNLYPTTTAIIFINSMIIYFILCFTMDQENTTRTKDGVKIKRIK